MTARKPPTVVAELGRPETPEEAAERKARTSRVRRENQTLFNLVIALLASLAVVAVIILVVVRPDAAPPAPVDYRAIAAEADASVPLAVPDLPSTWTSNSAIYTATASDGVANWYVGFITPKHQFIGMRQGVDANPTWLANQLAAATPTGSTTIAGITWNVYDRRDAKDPGNLAYAMSTVGARSTVAIFGTATPDEFEELAERLAPALSADH